MLRRLRISNLVLIREAELELDEGLNAITGETGAGKTILTNAIGLLLGARGDAALIGAAGDEAYVEAEFDGADDEVLGPLAELRPDGEDGLVLARRIFADGRTRAYAWGRSAAREDVANAAEALIAMSGQFEQRRLARPAYQRGVLDAFAGLDTRAAARAWRELAAARRAYDELTRDAAAAEARLEELRKLAADTESLDAGREDELRVQRERLRHLEELAEGGRSCGLRPRAGRRCRGDRSRRPRRAVDRPGRAGGSRARRRRCVAAPGRRAAARDRVRPARVPRLTGGRAGPARADRGRARELLRPEAPPRRPDASRSCSSAGRRLGASWRLSPRATTRCGPRPTSSPPPSSRSSCLHAELRAARRAAAEPFATAVAAELQAIGLGDGEFQVALTDRDPGATGADDVAFLIRPNAGLPFGPVAETASGGELSRVALAIAAVAGGETMVFDEIDAGIGGTTAHAVAETLRRLAARAQVVTITHLPQIATVADRHFSVEKVAGDPDPHAHRVARRRAAPRRAGANARRGGVSRRDRPWRGCLTP